jgi:hypothetical protein
LCSNQGKAATQLNCKGTLKHPPYASIDAFSHELRIPVQLLVILRFDVWDATALLLDTPRIAKH